MINGQKIVVVMPAYDAERTIEKTCREAADQSVVDLIIIVDDGSEIGRSRSRANWSASSSKRTIGTAVMAARRRHATASPSSKGPMSSSWCTAITNTHRS